MYIYIYTRQQRFTLANLFAVLYQPAFSPFEPRQPSRRFALASILTMSPSPAFSQFCTRQHSHRLTLASLLAVLHSPAFSVISPSFFNVTLSSHCRTLISLLITHIHRQSFHCSPTLLFTSLYSLSLMITFTSPSVH